MGIVWIVLVLWVFYLCLVLMLKVGELLVGRWIHLGGCYGIDLLSWLFRLNGLFILMLHILLVTCYVVCYVSGGFKLF